MCVNEFMYVDRYTNGYIEISVDTIYIHTAYLFIYISMYELILARSRARAASLS